MHLFSLGVFVCVSRCPHAHLGAGRAGICTTVMSDPGEGAPTPFNFHEKPRFFQALTLLTATTAKAHPFIEIVVKLKAAKIKPKRQKESTK